tara:strand:- start:63 stop:818 length:756 start_codon:yes stop_codon:yes gene_type:complete
MKKYNVKNYIRYKEDLKECMPDDKPYKDYTRKELIIKFMPLVENLARKFATSQQASGVMSINDLIQEGNKGLTIAVDKIIWQTIEESDDQEKTIKSFFSKRIKGSIRRAIDINRGDIRIPEHKLNEIRKNNGKDHKMVAMFFNSIFLSIDDKPADEASSFADNIEDTKADYNVELLNHYLLSLMEKHLNIKEYDVLRMSYGLDCDKHSAKQIANEIKLTGNSAYVRVSEIKREAINKLIDNVDHSQVIDYL